MLAIGSPFQLSQTVTAGIVSATGRANVGFADYEDFIQTDAAINPGNSGGALINSRGELVGINTGIFSQSGGYQGIGFAVPSNLAQRIVDDLMKYGEVQRGSIGFLGIEKLTPELAEEIGVENTSGALVSRMSRASEAYDVGLRPGDVIVGFNGQAISRPVAVPASGGRREAGHDDRHQGAARRPAAGVQAADRLELDLAQPIDTSGDQHHEIKRKTRKHSEEGIAVAFVSRSRLRAFRFSWLPCSAFISWLRRAPRVTHARLRTP